MFFLMMFFPVVRLVDMYLEWKEANIYNYNIYISKRYMIDT